jgi:hypothetical protein
MTRRTAWVLALALGGCQPILAPPDAGPTIQALSFLGSAPPLGVLTSFASDGGACQVGIGSVTVTSTAPDGGADVLAQVYLNLGNVSAPSDCNKQPLTFIDVSELPLHLVNGDQYTLSPLVVDLDPLVSCLFSRNDSKTNYLTVVVSDGFAQPNAPSAAPGKTSIQLVWGLDLACDPRP